MDIKELLREKAEEIRIDPGLPDRVARRARRHRLVNAVVAGATAVGVVAGAFFGIQAAVREVGGGPTEKRIVGGGGTTRLPSFVGIWPATTEDQLAKLQESVDQGHMPLLTDPAGTATEFSTNVLGWSPDALRAEVQTVPSDQNVAVVDVWNSDITSAAGVGPKDPAYALHVTVQQLGKLGEGGVWSVEYVRSAMFDLQCPSLRQDIIVAGSEQEVCGQVNQAPFEASFHADLVSGDTASPELSPGPSDPEIDMGIENGRFDGQLPPWNGSGDSVILIVRLVEQNGKTDGLAARKLALEGGSSPSPAAAAPPDQAVWTPANVSDGGDPQTAALAFAENVLQWNRDRVHVETSSESSSQAYVELWNEDMTMTFTPDLATALLLEKGEQWTVLHAETGLLDITCPSQRQDVIVTSSPVEICGTFSQPPAGWIVQATVEYAASNLQPSEAESSADLPVNGQQVHGWIDLISTYSGEDVSLKIRVYSGTGHTLGLFARRFVTEAPPQALALPAAVADTRQAIVDAAKAFDYSALGALIDEKTFSYSFGESGDPIGYWRRLERQGHVPIMGDILPIVLDTHWARTGNLYVWPAAFARDPSQWTQVDLADMRRLYSEQDIRSFERRIGGYAGYRVGIRQDGTWVFFISGD